MLDAIQVQFNTGIILFRKTGGMCYGLYKIPFLKNENIFIRYKIKKRIIHDIEPDILRQIIFMQTDHAVFLQVAIFFSIAETVAAVAAFRWTKIGMCIQVHAVDLRQLYQPGLVQAFGSAFDQWISIVMTAANGNRNFTL